MNKGKIVKIIFLTILYLVVVSNGVFAKSSDYYFDNIKTVKSSFYKNAEKNLFLKPVKTANNDKLFYEFAAFYLEQIEDMNLKNIDNIHSYSCQNEDDLSNEIKNLKIAYEKNGVTLTCSEGEIAFAPDYKYLLFNFENYLTPPYLEWIKFTYNSNDDFDEGNSALNFDEIVTKILYLDNFSKKNPNFIALDKVESRIKAYLHLYLAPYISDAHRFDCETNKMMPEYKASLENFIKNNKDTKSYYLVNSFYEASKNNHFSESDSIEASTYNSIEALKIYDKSSVLVKPKNTKQQYMEVISKAREKTNNFDIPETKMFKVDEQLYDNAIKNLTIKTNEMCKNFGNQKNLEDGMKDDYKTINTLYQNYKNNKNNMKNNYALYERAKAYYEQYIEISKAFNQPFEEEYNEYISSFKKQTGVEYTEYVNAKFPPLSGTTSFQSFFMEMAENKNINMLNLILETEDYANKYANISNEVLNYSEKYEKQQITNLKKTNQLNYKDIYSLQALLLHPYGKAENNKIYSSHKCDQVKVLQAVDNGVIVSAVSSTYSYTVGHAKNAFIVTNKKYVENEYIAGYYKYQGIFTYRTVFGAPISIWKFIEVSNPNDKSEKFIKNLYFIR